MGEGEDLGDGWETEEEWEGEEQDGQGEGEGQGGGGRKDVRKVEKGIEPGKETEDVMPKKRLGESVEAEVP